MANNTEVPSKTHNILMVGNSFSDDAASWVWNICQSAGIYAVVGVIEIGGCSLKQHWQRIENNEEAPFHKWDKTGRVDLTIPYSDVFSYDHWDVITFQQFSGESGMYETFQPYLTHLRDYARTFATNPKVEFGWHLTWAYATKSQHGEFVNYGNDQMAMYRAITNASQRAMAEMDFDIIIPSGTAIQNARTNDYLKAVGDELTSDGHHLEHGIGKFVAALTVFETIIASNYKIDLINDVSFYPLENGGTQSLGRLAKAAAKNAVLNRFEVTDMR